MNIHCNYYGYYLNSHTLNFLDRFNFSKVLLKPHFNNLRISFLSNILTEDDFDFFHNLFSIIMLLGEVNFNVRTGFHR